MRNYSEFTDVYLFLMKQLKTNFFRKLNNTAAISLILLHLPLTVCKRFPNLIFCIDIRVTLEHSSQMKQFEHCVAEFIVSII